MRTRREKGKLSECVRKNMGQLRKRFGRTQEHFARLLGLNRTTYNKKETGDAPIFMEDIEGLAQGLDVGVVELFKGYDNFFEKSEFTLGEATRKRFPYLNQIVITANMCVAEGLEELKLLGSQLGYAKSKIDKEIANRLEKGT